MRRTSQTDPGVISPDELYHLAEFKRRLGWGDHAMRVARRNGLKVQYIAGRAYVFGADGIDHYVLQELMRHDDIQTTMRYYVGQNAKRTSAILWEAHRAQAVGGILGGSGTDPVDSALAEST